DHRSSPSDPTNTPAAVMSVKPYRASRPGPVCGRPIAVLETEEGQVTPRRRRRRGRGELTPGNRGEAVGERMPDLEQVVHERIDRTDDLIDRTAEVTEQLRVRRRPVSDHRGVAL